MRLIWSREWIGKHVGKPTLYSKSSPAHRAAAIQPHRFFSILRLAKCLFQIKTTHPAAYCVAGRLVKISGSP